MKFLPPSNHDYIQKLDLPNFFFFFFFFDNGLRLYLHAWKIFFPTIQKKKEKKNDNHPFKK